ncbi:MULTISPECIES: hypothetical protein [Acidianus]|uniref:Uncharacterized protein n=1 Tax=Candidatus Acidianus copahuensis TaxID=1160895 RepID=A0A031LKR2_9CREN|nr:MULTISPECIES: hypothetical protein [Acidianus]EZQ01794.1 hypothetical protein CM19_12015 [Candidatus Acidianus copahuensis]NON61775.1 hypothetical protein [Acidianus sp. RZ1]
MNNSNLWLLGAGITLVQIVYGSYLVFFGYDTLRIALHAFIALVILIISILGYFSTDIPVQKRILTGNIGLVIVISIIGIFIYTMDKPLITLVHLFLALGLLSNFSVLYGMERGKQ